MSDAAPALERLVREEWGQVVATLVRDTGDLQLAEDCVQEAVTRALTTWPAAGVPDRPGAWLTVTARRIALDVLRRRQRFTAKAAQLAAVLDTSDRSAGLGPEELAMTEPSIGDEQLELLFACCHPSLAPDVRVALTLRVVAGLTTTEIARAFLVPEATLAQRLVRAKRKLAVAGIPFAVPPPDRLHDRVGDVLTVIYLVFNEGYASRTTETLLRDDLADEAIRLARLVDRLLPQEHECAGLLALLLLTHARRAARLDDAGEIVLLEHQDRSRWDRRMIEEGSRALGRAWAAGPAGPYSLQAAIAYEHDVAPVPEATAWSRIAELYGMLDGLTGSPVVALNRAVAVGMADGPVAGLALLDDLAGPLADYHYWHAARAELLRRLGHYDEAAVAYRAALDRQPADAERRYLERRLTEVTS